MDFFRFFKKIGVKIVLTFLLIGMLPLLVNSFISYRQTKFVLDESVHLHLENVGAIKKKQIEDFFSERQSDMLILMETVNMMRKEAFDKLLAVQEIKKKALFLLAEQWEADIISQQTRSICTKGMQHYKDFLLTGYKSLEYERFAKIIDDFVKASGYYDFFIIDMEGSVVYSQAKEKDYQTNLVSGAYKESGLAKAFSKAKKGEITLVDFSPYAPSNGEPAAFLAAPIILPTGEQSGVVALQISMSKLQSIMNVREGLGASGETYLVGKDGLMRSDSFLDPEHRSIRNSFANPTEGKVDTDAARWAFAGESKQDGYRWV